MESLLKERWISLHRAAQMQIGSTVVKPCTVKSTLPAPAAVRPYQNAKPSVFLSSFKAILVPRSSQTS